MARLYNNFEFTGELNFTKEPYRVKRFDSGWEKHELSLIINESKNNGVFVKIDTGVHTAKENLVYTSTKKIFGEQGAQVKIKWDERLLPTTVNLVPDFKKVVVDLTESDVPKDAYFNTKRDIYNLEANENPTQEDKDKLQEAYGKLTELLPNRKEFIHAYDAVKFLHDKLESYKGRKFKVKGQIDKSYYNGKFYTTYTPQSIELVSDEVPSKLSARLDLFFTKGAIDEADFKSDKILRFDTYILGYDNQHKKDVFFPQATVLNASKLDFENPAHVGRVNFIKKVFEVKGKGVYHIPFEVKVFRGAETVEFTEADLTPIQREMVELGITSLESLKPKGGLLGESIEEIRLVKPVLEELNKANDFREGAVESSFEVDDLTYVPLVQNTAPPKPETTPQSTIGEVQFDELDDLL